LPGQWLFRPWFYILFLILKLII